MSDISFVDTTLRDGQSSLWGYRMTTGMIAPIAARMDQAGFAGMEADSHNAMKLRVTQQKEEPWARIRLLSQKVKKTPLMFIAGTTFGFSDPVPPAVARLRAECLARNGIRRVNITGFMNDLKFLVPDLVQSAHGAGLEVLLGLVFGLSPKHTDEYYAAKTLEALKLKPERMYLKDPIGLLTPDRARAIIPAIMNNCGQVPFELHSHCTTGLAPLCYVEAVKAGVTTLHTATPPLANGPAQPSVLNIARNARFLGHTPRFDEAAVKDISDHFTFIARREKLPIGAPLEYDYSQYLHQIPGGVISNLKRQLTELHIGHKLPEVLEETARVRKELGYPMMYTPFSQFVVTQATLNIVLGERYKEVTDVLVRYALGYWGQEIGAAVEEETRSRILDRPRAKEIAREAPQDPTIEEIRQKLGAPRVDDDELLVRYLMGGEKDLKAIRPAPPIKEYATGASPLVQLIRETVKQTNHRTRYVRVEKGNLKLTLSRAR